MKNRKAKKGFTIIELVIVIGVIGILAAVLIPTFINLSNKASKASDQSLVTNLNKALAMQEADPHDKKNNTFQDAIDDLETYGYKLTNLVTKSEEDLLWNSKTNRFLLSEDLSKEENAASKWEFWHIQDNFVQEQKYSVYPGNVWNGGDTFTLNGYGFDAGTQHTFASITYQSNDNRGVVIRTNGGALSIQAPLDSVKHYGKADSLNITAIAGSSYHEFGEVGYAKIANGRFVIEEEAKIDGIYLVANSSGEFDRIKLAVVGKAEVPELARADVSLAGGQSKLVVEIQTLATPETEPSADNTQYVWISNTGSTEDPVVDSKVSSSKTDASAAVTNPSPAAEAAKETVDKPASEIDANSVARIGAVGFESLQDAFDAVKDNQTIYLLKDIEYNYVQEFNRNIIANFDLLDNTLKVTGGTNKAGTAAAGGRAIRISAGTLTIKNGTIDGRSYSEGVPTANSSMSGPWTSTRVGGCVRVTTNGNANLENLKMYNNDAWGSGIMMESSQGILNVRNCEFDSIYGSSLICGTYGAGGGIANVYSSKFNQSAYAGFNSTCLVVQYGGILNVYDTEIGYEDDGVEAYGMDAITTFSSGGTINIYGGKYSARNAVFHPYGVDNGYLNYAEFSQINIYGGTFEGDYELTNEHNKIVIAGGTFDHDPSSYVAEGYHATNNGDGTWTVSAD